MLVQHLIDQWIAIATVFGHREHQKYVHIPHSSARVDSGRYVLAKMHMVMLVVNNLIHDL
ncbi:hypothetical protein BLA29_000288 [Euroglyphus maynei]|uniref:Uncharacterized protein n=1 Tax=Euroglyphus maynei TaxID=6958 RepID=A0A1Y3B7E6_EURMA|nr:hypothetical protein BLA29_000288 [Euroglyphus maynei]